jgi:hypothetical protein
MPYGSVSAIDGGASKTFRAHVGLAESWWSRNGPLTSVARDSSMGYRLLEVEPHSGVIWGSRGRLLRPPEGLGEQLPNPSRTTTPDVGIEMVPLVKSGCRPRNRSSIHLHLYNCVRVRAIFPLRGNRICKVVSVQLLPNVRPRDLIQQMSLPKLVFNWRRTSMPILAILSFNKQLIMPWAIGLIVNNCSRVEGRKPPLPTARQWDHYLLEIGCSRSFKDRCLRQPFVSSSTGNQQYMQRSQRETKPNIQVHRLTEIHQQSTPSNGHLHSMVTWKNLSPFRSGGGTAFSARKYIDWEAPYQ